MFSLVQTKTGSLPEGLDEVEISELMEVNESLKNFEVEVVPAEQKERSQLQMIVTLGKKV